MNENNTNTAVSVVVILLLISLTILILLTITRTEPQEQEYSQENNGSFNLIVMDSENNYLIKAEYKVFDKNNFSIQTGTTSDRNNIYEKIINLNDESYKVFVYERYHYPKIEICNINENCVIKLDKKALKPYLYENNSKLMLNIKDGLIQSPLICYQWGYGYSDFRLELEESQIPNRDWYSREDGFKPFRCYYLKTTKTKLSKEQYDSIERNNENCRLITHKTSYDYYSDLICHDNLYKNETITISYNATRTNDNKIEPLKFIIIDKQYNEAMEKTYNFDDVYFGIQDTILALSIK